MVYMKEQNKIPEEGLSKLEISSLTNKAFKVMTIKMLRRRLAEHSEKLNKELRNTKKERKKKKHKEEPSRFEEKSNWNKKYTAGNQH